MSISGVARAAGVSASTVSRYLRGQLRVQEDTEARILAAMEATGFAVPREAIRTLALVVPDLSNPYFAQLSQAIAEATHHRGLELAVLVSDGRAAREREIVRRCARGEGMAADGILFVSMTGSSSVLDDVPEAYPFVVLDEKLDGVRADQRSYVGADNLGGAYQATSFLINRGHRRIAHVGGPAALGSARERLKGYLQALQDAGIASDPNLVFEGPYSESFGAAVMPRVVRQPDPPSAVFAASDIVAVGIAAAAPLHGFRIPENLSLVGFDGILQGSWISPQLSTVVQPFADLARLALDRLDDAAAGVAPRSREMPLELRVAASAGSGPSARP